jgi:uncharacterized membrane protein
MRPTSLASIIVAAQDGYHGDRRLGTLEPMGPFDAIMTVLLSAAPITELRGGIPFALARGAPAWLAFALALAGNLAVVPLLLFGLRAGERMVRRFGVGDRILDRVFARVRRKRGPIDRYGPIGLLLLVAVPLPGTGAWTGAIAAHLFGIAPRRASVPIVAGVLIAGVLVLLAGVGVIRLFAAG